MQTVHFSIWVNASRDKVWHNMLDDQPYRLWTSAFGEGGAYEGNWQTGSEMRFCGTDENGLQQGMFSRIKENRPQSFISIEHLGVIKDGIVDTTSEETKKWAPSFENYTFTDEKGGTTVQVDMQVTDEYKAMFEEMWPRALNKLKEISEAG